MFERFTDRARRVIVLAQQESRLLNHDYIGTEHILLGLIREGDGAAARVLESLGIRLESMRTEIERKIGVGDSPAIGHIPFTAHAKKALELSLREALQLDHNYIGTEHVLLGIIREKDSVGAQMLVKAGVEADTVRTRVLEMVSGAGTATGQERRTVLLSRSGPSSLPMSFVPPPPMAGPICSFCGRDLWDVERYVLGSSGVICDTCVDAAREVMDSAPADSARGLMLPPRVFGEAPSETAVAEVEHAVKAVFGGQDDEEWARCLEDGERLRPVREEVRARVPQHPDLSVRLDRIRFRGAGAAEMRFTIFLGRGGPAIPEDGVARRIDDRWRVSRDTYCRVVQRAGVRCPPREE